MKIDCALPDDPTRSKSAARSLEARGIDGLWSTELGHDPFLRLLVAAEGTERVSIGTNIAVAFARSPMTVAMTANDLQAYSRGRFLLGLGSQIKPHIERRFSMTWSHPAARMREYVLALRTIWTAWHEDTPLNFRGEHYRHTLMPPAFRPTPHEWGAPPVLLAGVGEQMTETAGEVADGFLVHPFTTERYLREVTIPILERGRALSGRTLDGYDLVYLPLLAVADDQGRASAVKTVKERLAFYGSTPAYRPVFALHGWEDLGDELNGLSKKGRWEEMGELIDDEVLAEFAVVGSPEVAGRELLRRFGPLVTRLSVTVDETLATDGLSRLIDTMRSEES